MSVSHSTARDARLGIVGQDWWEVELLEDGMLERRRHIDSLPIASRMVSTWLDGSPEIWDDVFGDVGSREWWERERQPKATAPVEDYTDRNTAIKAIRKALKERSGKAWSVTGDRGTAWGWINITAPPKRRQEYGYMTDEDCAELGQLLGLGKPAHPQGVSVAAGVDYRREYVARAQGREPEAFGTPYWD